MKSPVRKTVLMKQTAPSLADHALESNGFQQGGGNLSKVVLPSPPPQAEQSGGNLSATVQRMIGTGLARLQDPQPEGLFTRGLRAVKPGTSVYGLLPRLALTSALGLLVVSFAYYISPYGNLALEFFF